MAYIYKITNLINQKSYIGKTSYTIQQRWQQHKNNITRKDLPLYRAIIKYGLDNFKIEQVEECSEEELNEKEIYWINFYNTFETGYNATLDGEGTSTVDKQEVLTLWKQGKSVAEIASQLKCQRGIIASILNYYEIPIEERQERGYFAQGKMVAQLDKDTGEIINVFPTISQANLAMGKDKSTPNIGRACKGIHKTAYGYKWKFIDE